jgi:hypothetical protein
MEKLGKFFDRTARAPVDMTAKLVTSPAKYLPTLKNHKGVFTTSLPRPMRTPPNNIIDYSEHKRGNVTVLGYVHYQRQNRGKKKNKKTRMERIHFWQIRCSCGYHELRTHKTLARDNADDMCEFCRERADLQKRADEADKWTSTEVGKKIVKDAIDLASKTSEEYTEARKVSIADMREPLEHKSEN